MLEKLYKIELIIEKPYIAFLIGFLYSVIGINLAAWFFAEDPALVTVGFITVLLYPTIRGLIRTEIDTLKDEKKVNAYYVTRHGDLMTVYLLIFLGVMLGFSLFSVVLPSMATNKIFENQISVYTHNSGNAKLLDKPMFSALFENNLSVLILAFLTALFLGDGALFLLVWNASVWGTVFGSLAKAAGVIGSLNPVLLFFMVIAIVLPHALLEALSYIVAAVSGGVVSRTFLIETPNPKSFGQLILSALVLLFVAVLVLVIAVFVEQYVLNNAKVYADIIFMSGLH